MAIRFCFVLVLLSYSLFYSQNIDSLNSVYNQFYETKLLSASPNGQYVMLNHYNAYGKNLDELFNTKTKKSIILDKHDKYTFLSNDVLLMTNMQYARFQNIKTQKFVDIPGIYDAIAPKQLKQVILYDARAKVLIVSSVEGEVLWQEHMVDQYKYDEQTHRLIAISDKQLKIRDLKNHATKNYQLETSIQWLASDANMIYFANITASNIYFHSLDLQSDNIKMQTIVSPQGFDFTSKLASKLELREDQHLIIPLYSKEKLNRKDNPELNIIYTNINGKNKRMFHHMGIYNISENRWDYQPDLSLQIPIYKFLNEKGDFVVYDHAEDIIEEQQNVILDFKLVLDYGKSSYCLPNKRISESNYLWDRNTNQLVCFFNKRWWSYNISTGQEKEVLPLDSNGWGHSRHSGLQDTPVVAPIKIKGESSVLIANQFDYFLLDLKNHRLEKITDGEKTNIKYELVLTKDLYPKSSWNLRIPEINLDDNLIFKLFNIDNLDTGFASYSYKDNKAIVYPQDHYRELLTYDNGLFFVSHFTLEPFKLTKFEKGKYNIVYEALKTEKKAFNGAKYQVFQYTTKYGRANGVLLYPINYDSNKKYPMIVNVYQQKTLDLLYYISPYFGSTIGFNYMHYLMNDYMVMMPDIEYEIANVKNSFITHLEKSVDMAKTLASIDDKNIAVVGLSFGGYETGLALTNSNYFKTGVAGVMVSDLVSKSLSISELMTTEPNYMRSENQQMRMQSSVFDNWEAYLDNSPIYHLKKMQAPILIWSGLNDKNISPAQSKMFFIGLKRLQKKAIILEYVNETHNIKSYLNRLDLDVKTWQWLDYYLKSKKPADWIKPLLH